jgi:spore coat protein A, manganese oxidase
MCSAKSVDCVSNPTDPCCQAYSGPIPVAVHLHGGEVPSEFDGGPEQWFTFDGVRGSGYRSALTTTIDAAVYQYPNNQEPAPLWFHDHALGATRLNVYSGLAGAYLLTDPSTEPSNLPGLIPLVVQDRMFDTNGQLLFPATGVNPDVHPFWIPEFFGDVIAVNGKAWPVKTVEPRRYRLLLLNGSNARFYEMALQAAGGAPGPSFWVMGTDGGYLDKPVLSVGSSYSRPASAEVSGRRVKKPTIDGARCDSSPLFRP